MNNLTSYGSDEEEQVAAPQNEQPTENATSQTTNNNLEEIENDEEVDFSKYNIGCDPAMVAKIQNFVAKKKEGLNLNSNLKSQKQFFNPEILEKVVEHFNINPEYGTNYPAHLWDPYNFDPSDYYEALEKSRREEDSKRTPTTPVTPQNPNASTSQYYQNMMRRKMYSSTK